MRSWCNKCRTLCDKRLRRAFAFSLLVVASIVVLVFGAASALRFNAERARSIAGYARAIQQSRVNFAHDLCEETNARHDLTIAILNRTVHEFPPGSKRRADAVAHRALTLPILTTVTPRRACSRAASGVRVKAHTSP